MNVRYATVAPGETTVEVSVTINEEQSARGKPPLLPDLRSWKRACRRALQAFGDEAA